MNDLREFILDFDIICQSNSRIVKALTIEDAYAEEIKKIKQRYPDVPESQIKLRNWRG